MSLRLSFLGPRVWVRGALEILGKLGGPTRSLTQGARETRLPTSGLAHGPRGRDYTEKMLQDGGTSELGLTKSLEPVSMAAPVLKRRTQQTG